MRGVFVLCAVGVASQAVAQDLVLTRNLSALEGLAGEVAAALQGSSKVFQFSADEQTIDSLLDRTSPLQCETGVSAQAAADNVLRKTQDFVGTPLDSSTTFRTALVEILAAGDFSFCTSSYFEDSAYNGESSQYFVIRRDGADLLFRLSQFWS